MEFCTCLCKLNCCFRHQTFFTIFTRPKNGYKYTFLLMTALHLHSSLLVGEKASFDQPLHSIEPLLLPASERRSSPISPSFNSPAFQDLIARQPTHPDGPREGWDLGLNLLGDPLAAAEYKSVEERFIKNSLRRLHRATVAFEFLFGMDVFVGLHARSPS
ncbi:hypothetical protein V8B97DRAFT_407507 [Scleroderma yunnanense]